MRTASERADAALDDALNMTFPASDPIAPFMAPALRSRETAVDTAFERRRDQLARERRPS